MQDQPTPGATPGPEHEHVSALEGTFLTKKRYPGEPVLPPNLPAPPEPRPVIARRAVFTRVILPLAMFLVLVACIAWVAQYLPNWRQKPVIARNPVTIPAPIKFLEESEADKTVPARWENKKDSKMQYIAEQEQGSHGHYDFLFENVTDEPADLGLVRASCTCTNLEVCLLSPSEKETFLRHRASEAGPKFPTEGLADLKPQWQVLPIDETKGMVIPPHSAGLARMNWEGRKPAGEAVPLTATVWMQPHGQVEGRSMELLKVQLLMVSSVRFDKDKLDMGTLLPRTKVTRELWCWSSTRDNFDLAVADGADPCLEIKIRPLTEQECQELPERVLGDAPTRARAGYRVSVTLYEEKDGHQLDVGYFHRTVPLVIRTEGVEHREVHLPTMFGTVRSDIKVTGTDTLGKINLGTFPPGDGSKTEKVMLLAPNSVRLEHKSQVPAYLKVDLKKKGPAGAQTAWELDVRVPPGLLQGELAPDSAVILESVPEGRQPRRIRLPVTGTAVRGSGLSGRD